MPEIRTPRENAGIELLFLEILRIVAGYNAHARGMETERNRRSDTAHAADMDARTVQPVTASLHGSHSRFGQVQP